VHLDAGYDSDKTRALLDERGIHGRIDQKGEKGRSRPADGGNYSSGAGHSLWSSSAVPEQEWDAHAGLRQG
jgi:hypothetical protein